MGLRRTHGSGSHAESSRNRRHRIAPRRLNLLRTMRGGLSDEHSPTRHDARAPSPSLRRRSRSRRNPSASRTRRMEISVRSSAMLSARAPTRRSRPADSRLRTTRPATPTLRYRSRMDRRTRHPPTRTSASASENEIMSRESLNPARTEVLASIRRALGVADHDGRRETKSLQPRLRRHRRSDDRSDASLRGGRSRLHRPRRSGGSDRRETEASQRDSASGGETTRGSRTADSSPRRRCASRRRAVERRRRRRRLPRRPSRRRPRGERVARSDSRLGGSR